MLVQIDACFRRIGTARESELGSRIGVYALIPESGPGYVGQGILHARIAHRRIQEPTLRVAPAFVADVGIERNAIILEWVLLALAEQRKQQLLNRRGREEEKVATYLNKLGDISIFLSGRDPLSGTANQVSRYLVRLSRTGPVLQVSGSTSSK